MLWRRHFLLQFKFNYFACISVIFLSVLTNFYLQFKIKENQLNNFLSTLYLFYDILQLGILLYLTGGITNPFIILIIFPSIISGQHLNIWSSIILVTLTILILTILTFYHYDIPHPEKLHFYAPPFYLYSIPLSILIGLIFLVYFAVKFGIENRIRKKAYEQLQEIMAKENELLSLGGQAAAADGATPRRERTASFRGQHAHPQRADCGNIAGTLTWAALVDGGRVSQSEL